MIKVQQHRQSLPVGATVAFRIGPDWRVGVVRWGGKSGRRIVSGIHRYHHADQIVVLDEPT